jgi:hypothetical protein
MLQTCDKVLCNAGAPEANGCGRDGIASGSLDLERRCNYVACVKNLWRLSSEDRQAETFEQVALEYLERHAKTKKKSWQEDERIIKKDLIPGFGKYGRAFWWHNGESGRKVAGRTARRWNVRNGKAQMIVLVMREIAAASS